MIFLSSRNNLRHRVLGSPAQEALPWSRRRGKEMSVVEVQPAGQGKREAAKNGRKKEGKGPVKRFLFGVLVGLALACFFQWRGAELLAALGIEKGRVSSFLERMERSLGLLGETAQEPAGKAGKKAAREISP